MSLQVIQVLCGREEDAKLSCRLDQLANRADGFRSRVIECGCCLFSSLFAALFENGDAKLLGDQILNTWTESARPFGPASASCRLNLDR